MRSQTVLFIFHLGDQIRTRRQLAQATDNRDTILSNHLQTNGRCSRRTWSMIELIRNRLQSIFPPHQSAAHVSAAVWPYQGHTSYYLIQPVVQFTQSLVRAAKGLSYIMQSYIHASWSVFHDIDSKVVITPMPFIQPQQSYPSKY